ncbi:hypothetical protein BDV24DRAFT_167723 [Aspergillus arachidicola]|uniref:Uncharacterized protein n=1 Tax=Aspergillus arachidicola TaxID=656916 RepID=A0A5N6XV77_9EURO|nr:hypothetical protein BDV24DRAFT_167723 [Aspergillus arachidicola]
MHGRPSHIHDDNWGFEDIEDVGFYDHDENMDSKDNDVPMNDIQAGRRGFMKMVKLSKILSTILTDFFSLRARKSQDTVELYQRAFPVLEKLHIWHENVPHPLRIVINFQGISHHKNFYGFILSNRNAIVPD